MTVKIALLPGDGIGPEIIHEAEKVLKCLNKHFNLDADLEQAAVGGIAYIESGSPLPKSTLSLCKQADAILFGAVGGPQYDELERDLRPEKALLSLRTELELFANLRPATLYRQLMSASNLKPEVVSGLDIMIVRELTGGIYFGQPRGIRRLENGQREGFNTLVYAEDEIERIAHAAFMVAMKRSKKVCSVDKSNVLEVSELWREVMTRVASHYPEVELSHMYVDNAAMQLVKWPKQFDVIVTDNMFGDMLSDIAAMLTGSIGMLPTASLDKQGKGLYEPIHGSAPDISGTKTANPMATILSVAMMMRYSLGKPELAQRIEQAVSDVLDQGLRTQDIADGGSYVSTQVAGDAIVNALKAGK